ncbi:hypothetical protein VH15_07300 [Corynebacterium ulcerans]|nr:hypothetical protein VH15_07300 [Corynebacterium ulcerans]
MSQGIHLGNYLAYAEKSQDHRPTEPAGWNYLAYAEKSAEFTRAVGDFGNYLRVRGEKYSGQGKQIRKTGTTSAYAEKSSFSFAILFSFGNYLRVRGEKSQVTLRCQTCRELPPRTRRKD